MRARKTEQTQSLCSAEYLSRAVEDSVSFCRDERKRSMGTCGRCDDPQNTAHAWAKGVSGRAMVTRFMPRNYTFLCARSRSQSFRVHARARSFPWCLSADRRLSHEVRHEVVAPGLMTRSARARLSFFCEQPLNALVKQNFRRNSCEQRERQTEEGMGSREKSAWVDYVD